MATASWDRAPAAQASHTGSPAAGSIPRPASSTTAPATTTPARAASCRPTLLDTPQTSISTPMSEMILRIAQTPQVWPTVVALETLDHESKAKMQGTVKVKQSSLQTKRRHENRGRLSAILPCPETTFPVTQR